MKTRLAKFIADSGVASRRQAEEMILTGKVSVNGTVVQTPVCFVDENDTVSVNGKVIKKQENIEIYAFHKPINTMTTTKDPQGRKTIYDCLPEQYKNLRYIGRLDYKTTGLLLMTNNGEVARKLTLPSSNIHRVYIANVQGDDFSGLEKARRGITVDGINYRPMKITVLKNNQLKVEVCEGKKNEVRIVIKACGLPVVKLHRISFGIVNLGNLSVGKIQKLSQKTIDEIIKTI